MGTLFALFVIVIIAVSMFIVISYSIYYFSTKQEKHGRATYDQVVEWVNKYVNNKDYHKYTLFNIGNITGYAFDVDMTTGIYFKVDGEKRYMLINIADYVAVFFYTVVAHYKNTADVKKSKNVVKW